MRQQQHQYIYHIEAGIDTRYIIKHERYPTSSYLSIVDDTGEMVGAISDMDIISTITPNYLESIKKVVMMAEVICLDTMALKWKIKQIMA